MANANFSFQTERGHNWSLDWNGRAISADLAEASRLAIDAVNETTATIMRTEHPWETRTGQTEAAVNVRRAEIQVDDPAWGPNVWGEVYIENGVRAEDSTFQPSAKYRAQFEATYGGEVEPESKLLSTVDVALFLEFGTIHAQPFPWIYTAWDQTKPTLAPTVAAFYALITGLVGRGRDPVTGRITSLGGTLPVDFGVGA